MRLVLDTNVVVAALLWHGAPRRLLECGIDDEAVEFFSSPVLIRELTGTLNHRKFAKRITLHGITVEDLVVQYQELVTLVSPSELPRVVSGDPDDDHVIACAVAAQADLVVSGDRHLLQLKQYQNIPVVSPVDALARVEAKPI